MTPTDTLLLGLLNGAVATGKVLDPIAVFAGLYISGPTTNPPLTPAAFTLPDSTDAPAKAVAAWTAPFKLLDGRWCIQSSLLVWRLPDADNAFGATGWYLATALTGGSILGWEPISPAVQLTGADREISILVRLTLDKDGRWSASVVVAD